MLESSSRWVAYLRLEVPPGLSPITTVGRFATVEEAQVATDEVWVARGPSCSGVPRPIEPYCASSGSSVWLRAAWSAPVGFGLPRMTSPGSG
jgi:hypothetical protein